MLRGLISDLHAVTSLVAEPRSLFTSHLAKFLSIAVWDECFKRLESSVDALHTPTLVAVGDLSADSPLLVPGRFWGQRNVGQTRWGERY